jgi:hypothetical protein
VILCFPPLLPLVAVGLLLLGVLGEAEQTEAVGVLEHWAKGVQAEIQ